MELLQLTFSHVAVAGDSAALAGRLTNTARWQAHETYSVAQLRLAVQLEQRYVIVQRLTVVVVVDVGSGDPKRLRAGAPVLARQVVITHSHVDSVSRPHYTEHSYTHCTTL